MNDQTNTPVVPQPAGAGTEKILAIVSLVVGVISLCGLVVPIVGIPLGIIGAVFGFVGRRDVNWKTYATIGMALSIIGILLSCFPVMIISVMRLLGPKIGSTFSTITSSLP